MKSNSTLSVLLIAIVCASVATSFAQTGEVYSLNVVGFQKLGATSGFTMVSTPFDRESNTLDGVIGPQLASGKSSLLADNISIWNRTNQAYDTYWMSTNGFWYTMANTRATNAFVTSDMGFWIRSRRTTNQTVVVSGDVVADSALTNVCVPGFTMVSYPFSTEIDINTCNLTNGKMGKSSLLADNISVWDSSIQAYATYWLSTNNRAWYNMGNTLATGVKVGGGKGFWYRNRAATNFIWVEAKPYTL